MTNTEPESGNTTGRSDADSSDQRSDGRNDASTTEPGDSDSRKANLGMLNEDVAHPFDQTNGIVEGLKGDSDGTVDGELGRTDDDDTPFTVPSPRSAIRNDDE